jgi:phage major head subunit gpT-like protein
MKITNEILTAINVNFKKIFNDYETPRELQYTKIATIVKSKSKSEVYKWFVKLGKMRKWLGDKFINRLSAKGHIIENENYEETFALHKDEVEDSNLTGFPMVIQQMKQDVQELPDDLVFDGLSAGFTTLVGFDGKTLYAADHDLDGSTINNISNLPLTEENYETLADRMESFENGDGESLNLSPTTVVVGKKGKRNAQKIFGTEFDENGNKNPNYEAVEIVVSPKIKNADEWHLQDNSRVVRAIVLQERKKEEFLQTSEDAETFVLNGERIYSVEARYGIGVGLYFTSIGSTGDA